MTTSLELVERTRKYLDELEYDNLPDCGCCVSLYDVKIQGYLLKDLFDKLLEHPFILESSCNNCEEIQNSINDLCDSILDGGNVCR